MTDYKKQLTADLCEQLKTLEEVLAIWEGGSAATGFEDDYSDLDLSIVTRHKAGDEIFAWLDEYFEAKHGIARRFRIPEPSWHGMSQCVYLLKDSPELFYCDICAVERDNPHKLTEPDRHGQARVHYDPLHLLETKNTPQEELQAIAKKVWKSATSIDFVFEIELRKAVRRGLLIDSISVYHTFLQRCLIPLLNLKYRPYKADFGMRYIGRDYPPNAAKQVEELLHIGDDLSLKLPILFELYQETKKELAPAFSAL
jgi:hypothetical protein